MAPRPVTLTFAGDSQSLTRTFDKVGSGAKEMAGDLDTASSNARSFGGAMDRAGSGADGATTHFRGAADITDGLGTVLGNTAFGPIAQFGMGMADIADGIGTTVLPAIKALLVKLGVMTAATAAQTTATASGTAAQTGLNAALLANPIGLVVVAVAALVAGFVLAYKHCETFREIVQAAFGAVLGVVTGVWTWVKDHWPLLLAILTGPIGLAVLAITTHWDTIKNAFTAVKTWISEKIGDIVGFFTGMPGRISAVVGGMFDGIKGAFKSALNWVIEKWNSLEFEIPGFKVGPVGFGGFTLGVPDIPKFHGGGVVPGTPGAEVLGLLRAGETVTAAGAGRGTTIIVNVAALDPAGAATAVVRAIDEYESRNGPRYARA